MSFYKACSNGDVELVKKFLIKHDISIGNCGWALRYSCYFGYLDIIELLILDGRADPAALNNAAIQFASEEGYADIVSLLLQDSRVDPTDNDNYAIDGASKNGHIDVVEVLLQDGRVEPTDKTIKMAETDEIREMLLRYKYRVDGKEYCRLKNAL